jgi:hypothetical protein
MTRCFVIGPIGDKFAPIGSEGRKRYEDAIQVYEHVIFPACKANGLDPVRADGIAKAGEITEQIFRHLIEDEVVIADVSGGNPNVMYELGLRHTRDLLTIQIGEYGQLPFDINAVRTIQFSRSERGLIDARNLLEEMLAAGLAEGGDAVTATRVWMSSYVILGDRSNSMIATPVDASTEEGLDEAGFLEQLASIEASFPELTERVERIGDILNRLGNEGEAVGQELQLANSGGAPTTARLAVVQRFADLLQPLADELDENTTEFAAKMQSLDGSVKGLLRFLAENEDVAEADEFFDALLTMAESSRNGMESLNQLGTIAKDLGKVSKVLRRPGRQISAAIDTMARATAAIDDWESAVMRLRVRRAQPAQVDGANESSA